MALRSGPGPYPFRRASNGPETSQELYADPVHLVIIRQELHSVYLYFVCVCVDICIPTHTL